MTFPLTPQMVDKIAFAMEDQKEKFALDADTGELSPLSALGESFSEEKYVPLPRWSPAEGFHMMESFVTTLRNPVYRELLSQALAMGTGVFRTFKDTLKKNKEIEKLWFQYREKRLHAVIFGWYNANREARGLAKLLPEPEDTEELVTSDFSFEWGPRDHGEEILRLDWEAFRELFPKEEPERLRALYDEKRADNPAPGGELSPVLVAETPAGELAGFAWGVVDGETVRVIQLAVVEEYRGIGVGDALLRRFLTDIRARGVRRLTLDLAGKAMRFSSFFQSLGFRVVSQALMCDLDELPF